MIDAINKLRQGLSKSRDSFFNKIKVIFFDNNSKTNLIFNELEDILVSCDIGAALSEKIIKSLDVQNESNSSELVINIKRNLSKILEVNNTQSISKTPNSKVIVFIGVNGSGKTTSIGKLANYYKNQNQKVILIPADTFRAASFEQLKLWSSKVNVEIFSNSNSSDPGAVIYQGLTYAQKHKYDIILIDTAGRLQSKSNLMAELSKINQVVEKFSTKFCIEHYLVLDSNSGQNGLSQAIEFNKSMHLDGLIISKLDGTSKGGIVFRIVDELKIPIKFIGVGEALDDIETFNIDTFVDSFFSSEQ